ELIQPAFAIALLGSIESLLSAVVADGMIGGRHRSNAELLAQGSANIFSGLFGGIPATGAIARTVSNIKNGGRTPIAGMIHAITLLLIMLLLAPLAAYIPLACLAGILIVIAYHMSEWKNFLIIMKSNRSDVFILLLTFFLTILVDLIAAIEIGMVLSSFMFMKRMSDSLSVQNVNDMKKGYTRKQEQLFDDELPDIPDDVILYEINGPLFFAAANKFQDTIRDLKVMPKIIILRMRNVPFIDATAAQRLKALISHFASQNVNTILSGIRPELHNDLSEAGIVDLIGEENILLDIKLSLERAVDIIGEENGVSTVHL
ncbi:MAG: SulP family inorganic anion transporter, partial [Calditrichaeota bacterium]|nr:SulP family inorganic anion transporter [Calditrichota bacterium]